ncbi:hypothetical protein HELRODRAFT_163987 [Helobdella robusta]|uniref:Uncharacterized protein n=1 Tax=Helobdella robusta TaxID=6412 RepID=T1EUQ4_HELRO|nr:hypothetical protein HELRODRAFT_163987 [Helobdella robusta]ESN94197.1 hypothetical protein HELRODRAFT_163987 [Helobdella robusta]
MKTNHFHFYDEIDAESISSKEDIEFLIGKYNIKKYDDDDGTGSREDLAHLTNHYQANNKNGKSLGYKNDLRRKINYVNNESEESYFVRQGDIKTQGDNNKSNNNNGGNKKSVQSTCIHNEREHKRSANNEDPYYRPCRFLNNNKFKFVKKRAPHELNISQNNISSTKIKYDKKDDALVNYCGIRSAENCRSGVGPEFEIGKVNDGKIMRKNFKHCDDFCDRRIITPNENESNKNACDDIQHCSPHVEHLVNVPQSNTGHEDLEQFAANISNSKLELEFESEKNNKHDVSSAENKKNNDGEKRIKMKDLKRVDDFINTNGDVEEKGIKRADDVINESNPNSSGRKKYRPKNAACLIEDNSNNHNHPLHTMNHNVPQDASRGETKVSGKDKSLVDYSRECIMKNCNNQTDSKIDNKITEHGICKMEITGGKIRYSKETQANTFRKKRKRNNNHRDDRNNHNPRNVNFNKSHSHHLHSQNPASSSEESSSCKEQENCRDNISSGNSQNADTNNSSSSSVVETELNEPHDDRDDYSFTDFETKKGLSKRLQKPNVKNVNHSNHPLHKAEVSVSNRAATFELAVQTQSSSANYPARYRKTSISASPSVVNVVNHMNRSHSGVEVSKNYNNCKTAKNNFNGKPNLFKKMFSHKTMIFTIFIFIIIFYCFYVDLCPIDDVPPKYWWQSSD